MRETPRILIIDDQPTNRKLLRTMLEADGYEVSVAENGEDGLTLVRVVRPDAVLLDVMMPDMSGIDATRILKSNADTAEVPVVIVTSLQDKATRHQALEVGAEDFLSRPIDSHELRSRLRNLVRLKLLNDQVRQVNSRLEDTVAEQTAELAASREFLRASLDAMTALVAIVDSEMNIVAVNARWRDYWERRGHQAPVNHAIGKKYSPELLGVSAQQASQFVEGVDKVRRLEILTYAQELQSGQSDWEVWFLTQATGFGEGGARHVVITHQDITLQKLAENDLEDREYEWRTLVETTPAVILRLTVDGKVQFSNRDVAGYGMRVQSSIYHQMHADDRAKFQEQFEDSLRRQAKTEVQVRIKTSAKQYRTWHFSLAAVSYRTPDLFVIAVGHDVTEGVQAEQRLQESNRRFELLASSTREGLLFMTADGAIVDANEQAATMLRCDSTLLRSKNLTDFADEVLAQELLNSPDTRLYDRTVRAFSSQTPVSVDISVMHLSEHEEGEDARTAATIVLALSDIGPRKEAEDKVRALQAQLQQSQKMEALGKLAGGVAHDFNNLLTSIISFSGFVRDELPEGDPARDDIDEVLSAAERATGLTRQLLMFSRQRAAELQSVVISEALGSIEKLLKRTIGPDIRLELEIDPGEMRVMADPTQFDQIILNLVVNARDAMPSGGSIFIRATHEKVEAPTAMSSGPGSYVLISVRDTGEGMPPDVKERIFEPFFTTKKLNEGTGLGLATCYGVVNQLGGTIEVESELGKGSEFRILLPKEITKEPSAGRPRVLSHDLTGSETVLLIEDEETIRRLAERTLRQYGYEVLVAADAEEAIATFEKHQMTIDIVFSDIMLPNGNGFDIATKIRSRNPALPILLTSGYTGDRIPEEKSAEFPILWKPYSPKDLAQRLRTYLDEALRAAMQ